MQSSFGEWSGVKHTSSTGVLLRSLVGPRCPSPPHTHTHTHTHTLRQTQIEISANPMCYFLQNKRFHLIHLIKWTGLLKLFSTTSDSVVGTVRTIENWSGYSRFKPHLCHNVRIYFQQTKNININVGYSQINFQLHPNCLQCWLWKQSSPFSSKQRDDYLHITVELTSNCIT